MKKKLRECLLLFVFICNLCSEVKVWGENYEQTLNNEGKSQSDSVSGQDQNNWHISLFMTRARAMEIQFRG